MKLIFDLDYTLLDTGRFKKALAECLEECGIQEKLFFTSYDVEVEKSDRVRDFNLQKQLHQLEEHLTCEVDEAEARIKKVVENLHEFLFPGVERMLRDLKKEGHLLILFTHGNVEWQRLKIRGAGIEDLFDHIDITPGLKEDATNLISKEGQSETVLINDNPKEIKAMQKKWPEVRTVAIKGPKGKVEKLGVPVCADMEELLHTLRAL